jgi:hypothetical protein
LLNGFRQDTFATTRTAFTDLVGVQHPIVGFNRSPGVVAAVPAGTGSASA